MKLILWFGIFCLSAFNFVLAQVDPGIRDTCSLSRFWTIPPDTQVVMDIYVFNDEYLGGFTIPLAFADSNSDLDITCDSISFVGTRSTGNVYIYKSDKASCPECIDNEKNRLLVFAIWFMGSLEPGSGSVAKIYFTTGPYWNFPWYQWVDTTSWPPFLHLEFGDTLGNSFVPAFIKGLLEVQDINTPVKPSSFSLSQNFPNPFNPKTLIRFSLPKDSWVKLEVYNILGQKVKTLVDKRLSAGVKEVEWDGRNDEGAELPSGIYFCRIKAGDFVQAKKMVLIK